MKREYNNGICILNVRGKILLFILNIIRVHYTTSGMSMLPRSLHIHSTLRRIWYSSNLCNSGFEYLYFSLFEQQVVTETAGPQQRLCLRILERSIPSVKYAIDVS